MDKETFRNVWLSLVVVSKEFSVTKVYSSETLEAQANGLMTDTQPANWKLPGRGVWLGLGAGVLLTLVGTRILGGGGDPATEAPPPVVTASTSAQTVTVAPAQMAAVAETLTVNGTVQAVDLLEVTPQIGGLQIRQMLVRDGDSVAAGQAIATLDTATLEADIRQQQAQLAVAQAQVTQRRASQAQAAATLAEAQQNLSRLQSLADQGAISQQELTRQQTEVATSQQAIGLAQAEIQSAEAQVRSQQAAIDRLQTQLNQATVRAPADGIVAERFANIGDVASTGDPIISLIQNNQLELEAEVPQAQLDRINLSAPVTITSSSDSRINLQGSVQAINPVLDSATRTAIVNLGLPPSDLLRPGMFLRGDIVTSSRQGVVVPSTAVLPQQDGDTLVYVLGPDNQAQARTVQTGQRLPVEGDQPARVEIVEGLQAGEQVIDTGVGYLQDGDLVEVVSGQ
jgi:HlyD family secretion protein